MELERFEELLRAERDGELREDERTELLRACAEDNELNRLRERDVRLQNVLTYGAPERAPFDLTAAVMTRVRQEAPPPVRATADGDARAAAPAPIAAAPPDRPRPTDDVQRPVGGYPLSGDQRGGESVSWWSKIFISRPLQLGLGGAVAAAAVVALLLNAGGPGGVDGSGVGPETPAQVAQVDDGEPAETAAPQEAPREVAALTPDESQIQATGPADPEPTEQPDLRDGWAEEVERSYQLAALPRSGRGGARLVPVMHDAIGIPGFAPARSLSRFSLAKVVDEASHQTGPEASGGEAIVEIDLRGIAQEPESRRPRSSAPQTDLGFDGAMALNGRRGAFSNGPDPIREIEMAMSRFGTIASIEKSGGAAEPRVVLFRTTPSQLESLQRELSDMGLRSARQPFSSATAPLSGGEMRVLGDASPSPSGGPERPIEVKFHILPPR